MRKDYRPTDIQQRTFMFGIRIVKLVDRLPRTLAGTEIGRQLLRAGTSIGANVREADGAETHKDFVHKIGIAGKEAKETHYWLELVNAAVLISDAEVIALIDESDQIARILYAIGHRKKIK